MSETAAFDLDALPVEAKKLLGGGRVLQALVADPKYRARTLELIKDAAPDTPIPELDLQRDLDARVTGRVKPIEDANTALRDQVAKLEARLQRDDLSREHGLSDDDWTEIEALQKDGKIADTGTAIEHHRLRMSLSAPRPTVEPGAADFQQKLRKISPRNVKGLKAAAIQEGSRILRDLRGRRFA